jgi:hypothetical protein
MTPRTSPHKTKYRQSLGTVLNLEKTYQAHCKYTAQSSVGKTSQQKRVLLPFFFLVSALRTFSNTLVCIPTINLNLFEIQ